MKKLPPDPGEFLGMRLKIWPARPEQRDPVSGAVAFAMEETVWLLYVNNNGLATSDMRLIACWGSAAWTEKSDKEVLDTEHLSRYDEFRNNAAAWLALAKVKK
jgi:hypothetical protein